MSDQQIKVMYYAPLPEGRSHDAFRERWRQHGALAMTLPMWQHMNRYKQFDTLVAGQAGVTPELEAATMAARFGGVGSIFFRSAEALDAAVADAEGIATLLVDEVQTFGRELGTNLVPVVEHVAIPGEGEPGVTLMVEVHRAAGVTRETFSSRWKALGEAIGAVPELRRHVHSYVQNHALEGSDEWDGIGELSFARVEDFLAFAGEPAVAERIKPLEDFIDHDDHGLLLTRQALLYDEPGAPATAAAAAR